jgi:hypothetical protein
LRRANEEPVFAAKGDPFHLLFRRIVGQKGKMGENGDVIDSSLPGLWLGQYSPPKGETFSNLPFDGRPGVDN